MAYRGGAEQRPRQTRWCDKRNSAAKDSIEAGARGLRRTAVVRAPRATSTPPRAAPPRLVSYNGTVGGTVGRASRARLSTPRQPTPLLSGTFLTSAGRPPLRRMLPTPPRCPPLPRCGYKLLTALLVRHRTKIVRLAHPPNGVSL